MANYYTHFSLLMQLPTEEAQKFALNLVEQISKVREGEELPADFPVSFHEVLEDWNFEVEASHPSQGRGLWLHSENGGIDAVCALIQHLLQLYYPAGHVALEWSNDCSKPRTDAFGGGAAIITATKIKSISTGEWIHRHTSKLQR
jgi:hypothetical protein